MSKKRQLKKALDKTSASPVQRNMAFILWNVNGIENALEFVRGLVAKGLANPQQPRLL